MANDEYRYMLYRAKVRDLFFQNYWPTISEKELNDFMYKMEPTIKEMYTNDVKARSHKYAMKHGALQTAHALSMMY